MIKYLISSHKLYYDITIKKLVDSLLASGITEKDIFITVGGSDDNEFYMKNNIEHKNVTTNSFDWTSLIEVMKHDIFSEYEYLFLLHDTCAVGENFKTKLQSFIKDDTLTIAMYGNHPSSNIGLYKRRVLYENYVTRMGIIGKENFDKTFYVEYEDLYFINKQSNYFSPIAKILGYKKIYSDSTEREINYCPEIELYKYKANWFMRHEWVLTA